MKKVPIYILIIILLSVCVWYFLISKSKIDNQTNAQNQNASPTLTNNTINSTNTNSININSTSSNDVIVKDKITSSDAQKIIRNRTQEIIQIIKNKDWNKLSEIASEEGIRFSPYTFVDVKSDKVLSREQIKTVPNDKYKYTWGTFDGSGEPMILSFQDYYKKFIMSHEFNKTTDISYNSPEQRGNIINNVDDVYKRNITIEYHVAGVDPKYAGMDWGSLKIVLQEENGEWKIVAIVHDGWTI